MNVPSLEASAPSVVARGLTKHFGDFVAVEEMSGGLQRIRIVEAGGNEHHVEFPEAVYTSSLGNNPDINADFLRIEYQSMITPETVFDYRPRARRLDRRH